MRRTARRKSLLWTRTKALSVSSLSVTPVVRCASSQMMRSNVPKASSVSLSSCCWAREMTSMDW